MGTTIDLIDRGKLIDTLNNTFQSISDINSIIIEQPTVEAIAKADYKSLLKTDLEAILDAVGCANVEAIPKADYENRLKADMVAMLTELQLEIEEKFNDRPFSYNHHQRTEFYRDIDEVIQHKISSLKEAKDGENND